MKVFEVYYISSVVKAVLSYLLGLLAKIKCSICSYQCENWYLLHGGALFTIISRGDGLGSLASLVLPRPCRCRLVTRTYFRERLTPNTQPKMIIV